MSQLDNSTQRLLGGFIRMRTLHPAENGGGCPNWTIEELHHQDSEISLGTLHPTLRADAAGKESSGANRRRFLCRITPSGCRALKASRAKQRELFGEGGTKPGGKR
jgi:hypothetical protein